MKTYVRSRFLRLFVCVAAGPLILILGATAWHAHMQLTRRALVFLRHDLEDTAHLLEAIMEETTAFLIASGRVAANLGDDAARRDFLETLLASAKTPTALRLLDPGGREMARVGDAPFSDFTRSEPSDSLPEPRLFLAGSPEKGQMIIFIPIRADGASAGFLQAEINMEQIWKNLTKAHLGRNQHFYLLDPEGRILAKTTTEGISETVAWPRVDGYGTSIQGNRALRGALPWVLLGQPLVILAERDARDVLMPFFSAVHYAIVLAVMLLGCILAVGLWVVRHLTRPVLELRDAACAIEGGDLMRQAPVRHADEVGELADAFNRMTARLRDSLKRLEEEVAYRTKTEEDLKRSISMLRAMFDATVDAVVVVSDKESVVNWSTHFARMWHLPEDGYANLSSTELWKHIAGHLANPERFLSSRDTVNDGDTYGTVLLNTLDGRIIEEYARPNMVDGVAAGCVWCFRDITEQARRERELRESEERFRAIFESAHDGIYLKNRDLRYTHVNPAMERMFGIPASTLVGHTGDSVFGAMGGIRIDEVDRRVLAGEIVEMEDTRALPEGNRTFHVVKVPMRNQAGEIVGLCGITRDVTARKAVEDALRESENRYRLLAENVTDVIWTMNFDLQFTYMSPSVTQMQGYTVEEALARRLEDYLSASSMAAVQKAFQEELVIERSGNADPKRSRVLELQQRCKDGRMIWTEVTVSFLRDQNGSATGIVGVTRDITQRKNDEQERSRLEAQIQHTQKLESLGVLAGGIAHDFNNLLMGILGYAGLVLRELPPDTKMYQRIQQIEQAGQRAADLAKQLLAYSGRGKFVIESIDLGKLVQEMAQFIEAGISRKAVLRYNFAPDLPAIEGDATQIRQVVMNLITNASDAIGDNVGVISISTGVMEVTHEYLSQTYLDDSLAGGLYIFLEVSDTGCGMDEATKARIFDPFFTTKFVGRGLGLAATLGIIRSHHGAIKVYSEPGAGATFKVLFPAAKQMAETTPSIVDATAWKGSGVILVIDDEPIVRDVAAHTLEPLGFNTILACDGQEGAEMFERHCSEIVLVLLDMTMPRLSGTETYERIRAIRPDVPVILSSGYNEQDTVARFSREGLAGFIQKPYQPRELIVKVKQVLAGPMPTVA
ncbi:MAG TPA: PAS domain S-box protein [Candidatus Hydrogenedentes bacterium]|nr:PAS domain S-box protein [Candidatus Hydrogenedentota bacterium]